MIRVLIVDDHRLVRDGLAQLLGTAADMELVGLAADGAEAVAMADQSSPDVVLMDLSMPVMDGVEATRLITAAHPETNVVVLTSFSDQQRIVDALDAGALGYLLKHVEPADLLEGLRAAARGESPMDPKAARTLLNLQRERHRAIDLTGREREVLLLVSQGFANKQIASRLSITERTVKAHLTNVFQRLGVSDRTQAALWARDHLHP